MIKEKLTLKDDLLKLTLELQEIKNNQPIIEISQKPNEEIPTMESDKSSQNDEGSQTNKKLRYSIQ